MSFGLGELAVYPAHGVGLIESREQRTVGSRDYEFLVLRILENGLKIMIPAQNIREVGLRPLMGRREVKKVFEVFRTQPRAPESANWNRRHREYLERIKTGAPCDLAAVMGELMVMRGAKELSFGERKLLDTVTMILVKEVALASKRSEDEIEAEIAACFPPPKSSAAPAKARPAKPH
ncbi:MAG: CarD family transcriptional regulator [Candidatus Adiutrix sp.]|nr:CarD family transcriptional regulator [Candidatus Adiutrix sp.]